MFGIICCEDSLKWQPIDFHDMFEALLRDKDDSDWVCINVARGDALPENILDFQGIVITGSHYNVCDRATLPWFDPVCDIVRQAATRGFPKIYGGCFGCQLIGYALGGEVSRNPNGNFVLKAEEIVPTDEFCKYLKDLNQQSCYRILSSHGYCVSTLPLCATLLATSSSCENEVYVAGQFKNILACQSHPEFDYDYAIRDRIWPAVVDSLQRLTAEEVQESLQSFAVFSRDDPDKFCKFVSDFLRH
jgi:GMP synthase-like glutamine amidotransferase